MKAKRSNPLFAGFFRRNVLTSSVVLSFGLASAIGAQTLYWDANGDTAGSGNVGGTWDTGTNWSTDALGEATTVGWTDGQNAVFSAGPDGVGAWTATIGGTIATPSILFKETGTKTITGGTINIGGGSISSTGLPLSGADDIVISSILAGAGGLSIAAHGDATSDGGGGSAAELRLNGANTFSGGFTVTRGLVSFTNSNAFGDAANTITLNGGGILMNSGATTALPRNIIAGASGGTIRLYGGANILNHTGSLTGSTSIRRTDGGVLNMNGDGSGFTGTWNNRGGDTAFSTIDWSQMTLDSRVGGRVFFTNAGTSTVKSVTNGRDLFVNNGGRLNIETGTLNLVTGAGFWIQTQNTGSLTTSNGTLTVTNGTNTGTLQTSTHDIRIPIVDFSGPTPLNLVKNNDNQLALVVANSYTGGTTINGGRVSASTATSFGTGTVTVNNGGQAYLNSAGTFANNFVINGPGVTEAVGNLGAIRFQGGTLSGSINVATAARIVAYGTTGVHTGALTGSGNLDLNLAASPGTLSFTGNTSGYTGNMTLNAGTLNLSGTVSNITIGGGTTVNLNSGAQIGTPTLSSGSVRTLNVNSGSTVSGNVITALSVSDVNLNLAGSVTGNVLIDDGSILGLRGGSIGGNLSTGFDGTSNIAWSLLNPITVTGDLTTLGTQTVSLLNNPTPGSPATVLTYGGTFTGDIADFALANPANYRSAVFEDTGSAITVTTGSATRTWVGADATNPTFWNSATANWSAGDNLFFNGDAVVFDDSATGTTVAMQNTVLPFSVTFANSTKDFTVTGPGLIAGSTGITKTGTGAVTLGGANTFTGAVSVTGGVLNLGSQQGIGQTSGVTVASGARVNLNGQTPGALGVPYRYTWTIAGDGGDGAGGVGAIANTGADVFGNSGILNLILSGNAEIGGSNGRFDVGLGGGSITGAGFTLTKTGSNQIVIRPTTATNITYVVNAGTLTFEDSDAASGTNPISVNGTARLSTFGPRTIGNAATLNSGTTLGNEGGGTGTWTGTLTAAGPITVNTGGNIVIDGALSGSGNITRTGANTLFLQADASAYSGKINNSASTLRVESSAALGTATGADVLTLGGGVTLQGGTVAGQTSATIGSATQGITHTGTGTVFYDSGAANTLTIAGAVAGGVTNLATQNGTVAFSNALTLSDPGNINANLVVRNNSTVSFLSGATANVREINLGLNGQGTSSNMNIAAGASVTTTRLATGDGGSVTSVINQTGGLLAITGNNNSATSASLLMGHWGGGTSTYNLSGGTLSAPAAMLSLGWDTVGTNFNQSGGTANLLGINLNNGRNNAAAYTLTGGRLNLGASGISDASNKSVNLGGGIVGAFADWTSTRNISLTGTNGDVTVNTLDSVNGTTPRTITLSGVLSGSGGLLKEGAGNLVLNNALGTFTGTAVVSGGSLFLNSGAANAATVRNISGGTLRPGTPSTVGTALVESLDMDGGDTTIRVGTTKDLLDVNSFDVSSASTISIIPTSALSAGQEYDLIAYSGSIAGLGSGGITLNPIANPHYSAALDTTEDGFIKLDILSADTITWTGATNGLWDVDTTFNWETDSNSVASKFYAFDVVKFDDSGSNTAITLAGTINPASVEVDAALNYSFSGSGISGSTGLVKAGTGTLSLLNDNTYLGAVSITGGSVVVGSGGTVGSLGGSGSVTLSDATLTFNRSDAQTFSRTVAGTNGILVKNGPGTLTMSGNSHTCDMVINSGTLAARGGGWATSFAANRTITVNAPGVLDTTTHALGGLGGATRPNNIVINEDGIWKLNNEQQLPNTAVTMTAGIINGPGDARGGGTIVTVAHPTKSSVINAPLSNGNGAITLNVADGAVAVDLSVTGNISGGNAITKSGAGTMVSTGTNTYTGATNINAGVLQIGAGGTTGTLGTGAVVNNASLVIDRSDSLTVANVISGSGSLTKSAANVLTLTALNTYSGDTVVNAGTMVLASAGGMRFVPTTNGDSNQITGSGGVELSGTFTIDLTGADLNNGNSWTLVDVGSLSSEVFLSSFAVAGFTETANVHTLEDGDNTWTFSEATGVLSLTVVGGFDSWAAANIADPAKRARADDADDDGFTNLQEFLFGTDPDASTGTLTTTEHSGGNLIIRWRERTEGATYTLLESATLDNPWDPSAAPITTDGPLDGDYQPVKATATIGAGKDFFRVKGEEN